MTPAQICLLIVIAIIVMASARMVWKYKANANWKRLVLLLFLQASSAVLLFFTLFPPDRSAPAQQLQILTANTPKNEIGTEQNLRVYALPEAPKTASAERIPDLATVLRQFPNIKQLQIVGDGLSARDHNAAQGISIQYQVQPITQGIIELAQPLPVVPGQQWFVSGRVAQDFAIVELLDPSDTVIDTVSTQKNGAFKLSDTARGVGNTLYHLRVRDAKKKIIELLAVPIMTVEPQKLNVLSISGGVNPELKYLKRWAVDANVNLQSSVSLGLGKQIQTAPLVLNEASLKELDLLILDERAWMALSASNQLAIRTAVQNGMGVLLRLTGPLSSSARSQWRTYGFNIQDANIVQSLRLPEPNQQKKLPELMRQSVKVSSPDAVPLLIDSRGQSIGLWRPLCLGRVGVWWLNDSYRLVLSGNENIYGAMWSELSTTLARAKQKSSLQLPSQLLWVNERAVFCGLAEGAMVKSPKGNSNPLLLVTNGANKNCAAYWPKYSGWHEVINSEQSQVFYVRDENSAIALHRRVVQQATMALVRTQNSTSSALTVSVPGVSWPYFLAWLFLTTILWWLERHRYGFKYQNLKH